MIGVLHAIDTHLADILFVQGPTELCLLSTYQHVTLLLHCLLADATTLSIHCAALTQPVVLW